MIGILGGMGTQAGLDFCNKLAILNRGKIDQEYPLFLLFNKSNIPGRPDSIGVHTKNLSNKSKNKKVEKKYALVLKNLVHGCNVLKNSKCKFIVIPCNTAHYWFDDLQKKTKIPIIVFFHGGGFVMGDLDTHDFTCRSICLESQMIVVAVDYSLSPEHKFPYAAEEVKDVLNSLVNFENKFFIDLEKKNALEIKSSSQLYDQKENQFLADRFVEGTCPNCGYEHAYGDQCENCGSSLSPTDLINPKSKLSGEKPIKKETTHWFLPLGNYEKFLTEWIINGKKNKWKANVYGQVKSWIDLGLESRAITRDLDWGISVPHKNGKGKVLYVWFDAPIGYISSTKEWAEKNLSLIHI